MFIALNLVDASVYQMMRGTIVFITAIFSIIFLKRTLYRHHWSSLAIIIFGITIVGIAATINPNKPKPDDPDEDPESETGKTILGISFLLASQFCAGSMFIIEEKLLGKYFLHPLKVVGWEGIFGLSIYLIVLFIMQFISCEVSLLCPYGKLEDSIMAFREFGDNPVILMMTILSTFSIAIFNGCGIAVTKYASAAQRSTIDTSRTLLIWAFFLATPVSWGGKEYFFWMQLIGFIFLVIGTLVYNEIVIVPFFGFDLYTKGALDARRGSLLIDEDSDEDDETGINPGTDIDRSGELDDKKETYY